MIKLSNYSPGYIVVLKCAVSVGRIYICSVCCYCDCYMDFYQPLDTIKFACNSAGIEKLPDDDAHALKHVGAVK
jgi:hypothetical protein